MIKKIHKAIVGEYTFVSSPDYLAVENSAGDEMVHMTQSDFMEIIEWFMTEGGFVPKQAEPATHGSDKVLLKKLNSLTPPKKDEAVSYDPGNRSATQTKSLPLGESMGVVDLGALKGPLPNGRSVREGVEVHVPSQEPAL